MAPPNVARLDDYRQAREPQDAVEIEQPDGGVIVQFGGWGAPGSNDPYGVPEEEGEDHFENLVDRISPATLQRVAWELLDGIATDERARAKWIADRTEGMKLLALTVERPRSDPAGGGAVEGQATVRHPMLLEACIKFQSNFKREMLPAAGPVKIKNRGRETAATDEQAEKLADLMNDYFTAKSPEYYPDTDRMSFDLGFSGTSFKKPYHCPLRRRPVSDTVEAKDLIVSNDARDLRTAQRVTHRIQMTQAIMARMQHVGAYADVELARPVTEPRDPLTLAQKRQQGISGQTNRPEDQQYTLYECHTFLELEELGDGEPGLPLPYVFTIERESRQVLEVRRDWEPDDNGTYERRVAFVAYHFVPNFGFYSAGLLHILANSTQAVTAAWRILLDSGMFASFPGFLYAKSGARQDDLNFRVPPGGGQGVDLNGADDIRKTIMALPYKDPGAPTMQLVDNIAQTAQRAGGTAELIDPSGPRQNMPVGTMMAIVEQASQVISAVHERCYVSQAQELQQMLRLMREDPEAIWRLIEQEGSWTYDELVQTLNTYALLPVADPNTPTHVHRIMKMTVLKQLEQANPERYNGRAVDERILRAIKVDDPEQLFAPPAPPQATPPDPSVVIANATKEAKLAQIGADREEAQGRLMLQAQKQQQDHEHRMAQLQLQGHTAAGTIDTKREDIRARTRTADLDRSSRERVAAMQVAEKVAHSPYEDDNHAKEMERVRASKPPAQR